MNLWKRFWLHLTESERETPDLDPKVVEKGWIPGYGEVTTRTDVRLLNRIVKAKQDLQEAQTT